jgi:hypothetical protein
VYEEFLDVAALLPTKHLERLSSPANWWELTPIKLYRYRYCCDHEQSSLTDLAQTTPSVFEAVVNL